MNTSAQAFPLSSEAASAWPGIASIHDGTVRLPETAGKKGGMLDAQMVVNFTDGSSASIMQEVGVPGFYEIALLSEAGDAVFPQIPGSRLAGVIQKMAQERAGSPN